MQALTQMAWQDGVQSSRPQHSSEHCLCWAELEQASCALPTCGNASVSAPAHTANRTHRIDIVLLHQAGSRAGTLASGALPRHPRALHCATQVLRKSR
jgi:hypothetical protein